MCVYVYMRVCVCVCVCACVRYNFCLLLPLNRNVLAEIEKLIKKARANERSQLCLQMSSSKSGRIHYHLDGAKHV